MPVGIDLRRHAGATGGEMLDRVTESLLAGFSAENEIEGLPEDKRFEHFTSFSMLRRHYSRAFSTSDVVVGQGGDTGSDGIAIIVNNVLVTDADQLDELAEQNDYVEPTFIFVQSERTAGFSAAKIGTFGFGVADFFSKTPKLVRSSEVQNLAEITDLILGKYAAILKPPKCYMYYVTTGQWIGDQNLEARRAGVVADLKQLSIFENPEMLCMGATDLHRAYRATKSPITRSFLFDKRVEIPPTEGVTQAALGYLPFSEFKKLLLDDGATEMLTSIFEDNIRDFQGYKVVNTAMRATLQSDDKSKFVLMNNGVTIITRSLTRVGDNFTISDYQIVNGCQSSNVLFDQRTALNDSVMVPVRLIHTEDERIKDLITTATNSQTDIKPEQFVSGKNFARGLESFFATYPEEHRLYYERRDGQYDKGPEQKKRIIDAPTVLRSYAAIFMEAPHTSTKSYRSIRDLIGSTIFADGHKYIAYYYAAYAWFLLEELFRNKTVDSTYKSARFHILMAVHLLIDNGNRAQPNSHDLERRCQAALQTLWDTNGAVDVFTRAVAIIDEVTGGNLDRDHVRTEAITNAIIAKLRPTARAAGAAATEASVV
jgi:hypothetical protein